MSAESAVREIRSKSHERVLAVATELFAEHGYHGVSTRRIAEATKLNISTVHHHVGSKRDLYLAVVDRLYEVEARLIQEVLERINDEVVGNRERLEVAFVDLIHRLVDHAAEHPSRQRLYIRRWLDTPDDLRKREAELTLRLYSGLRRVVARGQELGAVAADLDIGYFLRSVDWMIVSYFTSGAFDWKKLAGDPLRTRNLQKFKRHLIVYTRKMLEI